MEDHFFLKLVLISKEVCKDLNFYYPSKVSEPLIKWILTMPDVHSRIVKLSYSYFMNICWQVLMVWQVTRDFREYLSFVWWDSTQKAKDKFNYFLFCRSQFYLRVVIFCEKCRLGKSFLLYYTRSSFSWLNYISMHFSSAKPLRPRVTSYTTSSEHWLIRTVISLSYLRDPSRYVVSQEAILGNWCPFWFCLYIRVSGWLMVMGPNNEWEKQNLLDALGRAVTSK